MKVINVVVNRDNFYNKLKFASERDWSKQSRDVFQTLTTNRLRCWPRCWELIALQRSTVFVYRTSITTPWMGVKDSL